MTSFITSDGILQTLYLTDYDMIDRNIGGRLWVWGRGTDGALGDSGVAHRSSPVQTISAGTNWRTVSLGSDFTGAIKTDGSLWMWGIASVGQLGNGLGFLATSRVSSPVQTLAGGNNWRTVSCGSSHAGAIKTDGTLWMWGQNTDGRVGDNTAFNHRNSPVQTVAAGTNWKDIACGAGHTLALKTDGTLWVWGQNSNGQLGTNDATSRSSPVQTVAGGNNWRQISSSAGSNISAAIKTDGTLWVWGLNNGGQLGDNTITNRSSPIQTVSAGTNWRTVSCGSNIAAIKTDGTLWVWGQNNNGQLGTNDVTPRSSPVQTVAGGNNWKLVSCGASVSAIKTDGTLWVWGFNTTGNLADNTTVPKSSPIQTIMGGNNWKFVSINRALTYTD